MLIQHFQLVNVFDLTSLRHFDCRLTRLVTAIGSRVAESAPPPRAQRGAFGRITQRSASYHNISAQKVCAMKLNWYSKVCMQCNTIFLIFKPIFEEGYVVK